MGFAIEGKEVVPVLEDRANGAPRFYIALLTNSYFTGVSQHHPVPAGLFRFDKSAITVWEAAANDIAKYVSLMDIPFRIDWIFGSVEPL